MISLHDYILEALDQENLIWKIETYFKTKKTEYNEFVKIVDKCKNDNTVAKDNVENYLKDTHIKIKPFIDFLDDDIKGNDVNKDYLYLFTKTIECILSDKSPENIFNN